MIEILEVAPLAVKGDPGAPGISITSASVNGAGELVVGLSNGVTLNAGVVRGPQGLPGADSQVPGPAGQSIVGPDGLGIASAAVVAGDLVLTLTDDSEIVAGAVVGPQGLPGADSEIPGPPGESIVGPAGVGVTSATVTNERLLITLSTGAVVDAGAVVGPAGEPGRDGLDSTVAGPAGQNGVGVSTATVDGQGRLVISLTNNQSVIAGLVVGPAGATGQNGIGLPTGGAANQILAKNSSTNFDTAWINAPTGGGEGFSGVFADLEGIPTTFPPSVHTHDYAPTSHTHDYAATVHSHDYAATNHTHDYAPTNHTHDYAPTSHTHDYAATSHTHADLIPVTAKGAALGVATLDADGKVPAAQLPAQTGGGGSMDEAYIMTLAMIFG